jgi:hypothetical protein
MPAKTTLFQDPDGTIWRWCTGSCGRPLSLEHFYPGKRGYHDTRCKDCKRMDYRSDWKKAWKRKNWRERYYSDPEYRAKKIAECRLYRQQRKAS